MCDSFFLYLYRTDGPFLPVFFGVWLFALVLLSAWKRTVRSIQGAQHSNTVPSSSRPEDKAREVEISPTIPWWLKRDTQLTQ